MTIKLIIFDLDGVLIDSGMIHFHALNDALIKIDPKYVISEENHNMKYNGLSTKQKLALLTKEKGLNVSYYDQIQKVKQEKTLDMINKYEYDDRVRNILSELKKQGYVLYCASNCIWNSVKIMLLRKGFLEFFDYFVSNEEIKNPKPNADIYFHCMQRASVGANEVMICEDSFIGRSAAVASGANLCPIDDPNDLTLDKINKYISLFNNKIPTQIWSKPINVVIPMAGFGSRFSTVGYTDPKPLIKINGKTMIQIVVENLNIQANYIFIVREEHMQKYNLKNYLESIAPNCKIIIVNKVTDGAARSVLLASEYIDNMDKLLIVNSDQYLEWNCAEFLHFADSTGSDGCISTFYNTHPKWSYAKVDSNGKVIEVQEKNPISTLATTGIYYWKHGSDYVKYANQMISKNIRTNNEFYVCPVYNEAIEDGKLIKVKDCTRLWGLGTPEDLNYFTQNFNLNLL